jgi:hypothetical protein
MYKLQTPFTGGLPWKPTKGCCARGVPTAVFKHRCLGPTQRRRRKVSVVKDRYRGTTVYFHVKAELVRAAQYRGLTTYQDIAVIMGLPMRGSHMSSEVGTVLGEISEDEVSAGRPMLSAVAVSVQSKVGPGFFTLASDLGRLTPGTDDDAFWRDELQKVYTSWKRPLPGGS